MDKDDLTVVPEPEYDVNVQETIERLAEERGLDLDFLEYEQPILQAYTRREDGKYVFEMTADKLTTQEQLEKEVNENLDGMIAQMEKADE